MISHESFTCCDCSSQFSDVAAYVILVVPAAIGYALWRIFVTNRTRPIGTTTLGLNENSAAFSEVYDDGISWQKLLIYGLTGCLFAFEAFSNLMDLLMTR